MKRANTYYLAPAIKVMAVAPVTLLDATVKSDNDPIGQDPNPDNGDDQAANRSLFDEGELTPQRNIWDE